MAATETSARANEVLDELYRQHVGDVYRYTYAVLGNHADAEDVTQTTFVNALRALERGEIPEEPSHWLTVIAHNLVRQRWRQAANRPALVELETDVPDAPDDDEEFELEELVRALQRIPETQREAIVMRELEGRSYREIATVLGLSTSALETLLFRARRSLADELENVVTCQTAELSISKLQDGRLSRKERRRLDEHLADCPDCTRLAAAQQRRRRAFKGLALLPLPIGLALFKGAPSAAAATSLPTIGLGTATAGSSGTGAGTAGAGATAATTGGTAAGGSLAGGLVVKIAAVVVTATVATGVGYKGVQAMRGTPTKPAPADVKAPGASVTLPPSPAHGTPKANAKPHGKKGAGSHDKAVASPGRAKHDLTPPPGLTHASSAPAATHATSGGAAADVKPHVSGQTTPKHVDAPAPAPQPKQPSGQTQAPKAGGTATGSPKQAPPKTTPSAPSAQTPPPSGSSAPSAPQTGTTPPAPVTGTSPTGSAAATPPQATSPETQQPPTTSNPAPAETPPSEPTTPPGGTTEPPTEPAGGPSNNGLDHGKKLGYYNENQDGKHLVGS